MSTETHALLYLRAARASDAAIAEQRSVCTGYAEARGWRILDVVVDNGVGGLADTPGLEILRDRIARGEAQAVIATDLVRISRDPQRVHSFARFCQQHAADLCLVEQPVNFELLLKEADHARAVGDDGLCTAQDTRQ